MFLIGKRNLSNYINDIKNLYGSYSEENIKDANNWILELNKLLITSASIIIAFSTIFLKNDLINNNTNFTDKLIFIIALFLMFFSIIFGLIQIFDDYRCFKLTGDDCRKVVATERVFNNKKEFDDFVENIRSKMKAKSKKWPTISQSILLSLGIGLILTFILKLFFF